MQRDRRESRYNDLSSIGSRSSVDVLAAPPMVPPTPEEVGVMRSTIETLRHERDSLLHRLQAAETQSRERTQLVESRWREALSQVDALKRAAHTVRRRLEGNLQKALERADLAQSDAEPAADAAEQLELQTADLTAILEASQARLADLETESGIFSFELQRLESDLNTSRSQISTLHMDLERRTQELEEQTQVTADTVSLIDSLHADLSELHQRQRALEQNLTRVQADRALVEAERQSARAAVDRVANELLQQRDALVSLEQQLAAQVNEHAKELAAWHAAAEQREAEVVAARDDLARQLEEEQSRALESSEHADRLTAHVCALQAQLQDTVDAAQHLQEELQAAREELHRERVIFDSTARQREGELRQTLDDLHTTHEVAVGALNDEQTTLQRRIDTLEHELAVARIAAKDRETVCEELERLAHDLEHSRQCQSAAQEHSRKLEDAAAERTCQLTEAQQALEGLERERATLRGEIEEGRAQIEELRIGHSELEAQIEERSARIQELQAAVEAGEAHAVDAIAKIEADALALLEEHDDEKRALLARVENTEHALYEESARLERERDAAEERAAVFKAHLESLQEESVDILQAQEAQSHHIETLESDKTDLLAQLESLAERIRLLDGERTELIATQARANEQNTTARHNADQLLAQHASLTAQLEETLSQLRQADAVNRTLQRQLEEQGNQLSLNAEAERERTDLRLQVEKLSAVIRQLGREKEEAREQRAQSQQGLTTRLEELTTERETLHLRIGELETLTAQLERECDRLRRDRASADEVQRYKSEVTRLEAKVEEIERQRIEAAQNHSAAVAGYMVELNQRSEALQERELQVQKALQEIEQTRQLSEEIATQLRSERQRRSDLEREVETLRATSDVDPDTGDSVLHFAATTAPAVVKSVGAETKQPSRVAASTTPAAAAPPPAKVKAALKATASGPLTVIHIDESKEVRDQLRRIVTRLPDSRYLNAPDVERTKSTAAQLLAVNLLNTVHDPLALIASNVMGSEDRQNIFAYCLEGTNGFTLGNVSFFTQPLDPDACIAWLLETRGTAQRLLAATNNVEMSSRLRTVLTNIRCSTSVALDLRQVMDLIPMTQPEVLLVDLTLPRAEGLRLINRLRVDTKTRDLPIAILLPEQAKLTEFRQHAPRVAREGALSPEQIASAFEEQFGLVAAPPESPLAAVAEAG
ncbi:MAG: hypothetical protein HY270_21390 [Deltaproteobacteria bacterium]|nr:hypothetical protein [Deltaproteobacteria bacterium]